MNPKNEPYTYETAGLDNFLSRSIDSIRQQNLNEQGPRSLEMRYDGSQVSGPLGDTLALGLVTIEGKEGIIRVVTSNGDDAIKIGDPEDPGQLLIPRGAIYIYDRDGNPTIINGQLVGSKTLGKITRISNFTVGAGVDEIISVPLTYVSFVVPDGVTLIKLTLYPGAGINNGATYYVFDRDILGGSANFALDDAHAKFKFIETGGGTPGTCFTYIDVLPGQQISYYLAIFNSSAFGTTWAASLQNPLIFMIEIA